MPSTTTRVSAVDVDQFLARESFSGYQSVPLPHGRCVPGKDRSGSLDAVFATDVGGKSVLDVGCYYGRFAYEAVRRGATRVVGVESDGGRSALAQRIARLHGDAYEVRQARVEDLPASERYDVVLLLNVIHHLDDPLQVVRRLAAVCDETLVVEFPPPWDRACMSSSLSEAQRPGALPKIVARVVGPLIGLVLGRLPLMAVGRRPYHQAFSFSPRAFWNIFVVHQQLFTDVRFSRSGAGRWLAVCTVARPAVAPLEDASSGSGP